MFKLIQNVGFKFCETANILKNFGIVNPNILRNLR